MLNWLAGVAISVAAFTAPLTNAKPLRLAPGEARPAPAETLRRLSLDVNQSAIVHSLWAERPARQCAVAARYALVNQRADFGGVFRLEAEPPLAEAPSDARGLLARLNAAGYSPDEAGQAAAFMPAPTKEDASRRAA